MIGMQPTACGSTKFRPAWFFNDIKLEVRDQPLQLAVLFSKLP
jgi:hypothetical protein